MQRTQLSFAYLWKFSLKMPYHVRPIVFNYVVNSVVLCKFVTLTGDSSGPIELKEDNLREHALVFKRYLDGNVDLEVQALFALQRLMAKLQHPSRKY